MAARGGDAASGLAIYGGPLVVLMGVLAAKSLGLASLYDHVVATAELPPPLVVLTLGLTTLAIGTLTRWQYGVFAFVLFNTCSSWQIGLLTATLFGIGVAAVREIYLAVQQTPPTLFEQRLRRRQHHNQ